MNANAIAGASASAGPEVQRLKPVYLLGIYGFIPVIALFLLIDALANDLGISRSLPADPHSVQWFNLFFMMPHIFASFFTFLDRDYLVAYKKRMAVSVPAIALAVAGIPFLFGMTVFMIGVGVYTIFHLVSQQTGIAALIARNKSPVYQAWKWISFFAVLIISLVAAAGIPLLWNWLRIGFPVFLVLYGVITGLTMGRSKSGIGKAYIAANALMIAFCYFLLLQNLPFFMVLILRVVHDVTAFFFYISHNTNRNSEQPQNVFARLRARLSLPEYIFTPLMGILCTTVVAFALAKYIFFVVAFLGLFHYYWEGVMWKQGSPHRAHIYV